MNRDFGMPDVLELLVDRIETPIGAMLLVADRAGNIRAIDWSDYEARMHRLLQLHYGVHGFRLSAKANPHGLRDTILRYFAGDVNVLEGARVETAGTAFQRALWAELRRIPGGTVCTYEQVAARLDHPKAVRAVGAANGANPVGVVVPCHRLVGKNGSLTGYGGGLERKRWLLEHERRYSGQI